MIKIGKRNINLLSIIFDKRHYIAAYNNLLYCEKPFSFFRKYLLDKGEYPCRINLKTPIGNVSAKIFSFYDSLTLNEIFFRGDYKSSSKIKTVVDIGANIGISALYFLSRNKYVKVYLFEPVKDNLKKLEENLSEYSERITVSPNAVFTKNEKRKIFVEESGRFGGLNREFAEFIEINCISINDVLKGILEKSDFIDVLKIDIEGDEVTVTEAILPEYLVKIKTIFFEVDGAINMDEKYELFPEYFTKEIYGTVYIMRNKALS